MLKIGSSNWPGWKSLNSLILKIEFNGLAYLFLTLDIVWWNSHYWTLSRALSHKLCSWTDCSSPNDLVYSSPPHSSTHLFRSGLLESKCGDWNLSLNSVFILPNTLPIKRQFESFTSTSFLSVFLEMGFLLILPADN